MMALSIAVLILVSWLLCANAMNAFPYPIEERQPDGSVITLVNHGNEKNHWTTDSEDFPVLQLDDGSYVYADLSNGNLSPTEDKVGKVDPKAKGKTKAAHHNIKPAEDCFKRICGRVPEASTDSRDEEVNCHGKKCNHQRNRHLLENDPGPDVHGRRTVATTGTLKNLVVLLYFNDHHEANRKVPSVDDINVLMNSDEPDNDLCPTGSLKGVYHENSYGQLTIESTVTEWFVTEKSEKWYADGVSGSTNLHQAFRDALDYLDDENIIDFSDFDEDNDGYIDSITFLHSGYAAEWGSNDCSGAKPDDRIWSHKWMVYSDISGRNIGPWVSKNGVKVWDYHINPALWGECGDEIGHVGVIAHETGHFLGIPDLYDQDGGGKGLGSFCQMANVWGFDGSQYYPGHMSAWVKMSLNWLQPVAPNHGVNIVDNAEEATTGHPQLYKIDAGFPSGEYLLIENRQQKGADKLLPHGGLAIYHIDEKADWDDEGYPGQRGWPGNGKHYRVALLQADGYYNLERGQNDGGSLDFFFADGVGSLMPSTGDPEDGPFPNTDSYQEGKIKQTGVEIFDISVSGNLMTFTYRDGNTPVTDTPSASPTQQPSSLPTKSPEPSAAPSHSSRFPTASPSLTHSALPTTSQVPTVSPSSYPSKKPSVSAEPTSRPSAAPSTLPSSAPSSQPSLLPSSFPSTSQFPTVSPSSFPSTKPSVSAEPTSQPSAAPSTLPSSAPSSRPSHLPSSLPTGHPTQSSAPSRFPTSSPNEQPSAAPIISRNVPAWWFLFN